MSDLKMKSWHIENLIELEPDAQVVLLVEAQEVLSKIEQERDKMERALKKMISMYVVDDYISGEDRINEVNKRFDRIMREA